MRGRFPFRRSFLSIPGMLPLFRRIHRSLVSFQYHKTLVTSSSSSSSVDSRVGAPSVAVFWDLDNKPPKSIHPYDAAVRLRLTASSLGPLRFVAAYATPHALRNVPAPLCASRLEDSATSVPHICRVCGRKFFVHSKLLNHFKIHEREHAKRLRRLDSATGGRYVRLKAQLNLKMDKYRKVAKEILIPRVGYGLGDELQRAGVSVRIVEDRPEAADRALREHMVETMDRRRVGCLVLVSDDTGFVGVIREARMRCLKTVVVGDDGDGALKRCADASFSWKEVVSGKARKEAASSVLKWNDKDLLKKLEWRYAPELEPKEKECSGNAWEDIDSGDESTFDGCEDLMETVNIVIVSPQADEPKQDYQSMGRGFSEDVYKLILRIDMKLWGLLDISGKGRWRGGDASLRQKLEQVVVLDTLDQEKSGIISKKKKDDKLVLTETIHGSSEELPNNKCIICFFGNHINHSYLKPKESIVLCEDCKFKIASFYMLHVQKWHELLSPRSKKKVYGFAGKKERSPSRASSCRTGRGGRRRRHQTTRKKAGRRSYQQILRQRYEAGDPTVGPLGQPSGKFDYLVEYSMAELGRNSFNMPYEDLFSPTGWGDAE